MTLKNSNRILGPCSLKDTISRQNSLSTDRGKLELISTLLLESISNKAIIFFTKLHIIVEKRNL